MTIAPIHPSLPLLAPLQARAGGILAANAATPLNQILLQSGAVASGATALDVLTLDAAQAPAPSSFVIPPSKDTPLASEPAVDDTLQALPPLLPIATAAPAVDSIIADVGTTLAFDLTEGSQGADLVAGRLGGGFQGFRPLDDLLRANPFAKEQVDAVSAVASGAALPFRQAGQLPEAAIEQRRQSLLHAQTPPPASSIDLLG